MMRYHEMVIEGPRGWGAGFVHGFLEGRGSHLQVLDAEEEGFEVESLRERIRELLVPTAEILHLVVPEPLVADVRRAVKSAAARGRAMTIRIEHAVSGIRFRFEFIVYSRQHATRLRRRLEQLPPGARLSQGTSFTETRDPDATGLELYAPAHEYELRAEGEVEGDLEAVLPIYRFCRDEELVRVSRAALIAAGGKPSAGRRGRR
ncbi:MAG TPA: hypothetical protein VFG08_10485 [Candidatus Polarisedimenticolia bacterium]|nr:hypothetical protein [Candidatus Polarisedimenticolia bacterium]